MAGDGGVFRRELLARVMPRIEAICCAPDDSDEVRFQKALFTASTIAVYLPGLLWGLLYAAFDAPLAAVFPVAYTLLSALNLAVLVRTRRFPPFRRVQLALILLLPLALHVALGGFVASGAVLLWSLLAPLGALVLRPEESRSWFASFVVAVLAAGALRPDVGTTEPLGPDVILGFFVLNIVAVAAIAFVLMFSLVRGRARLRELERAYLQQEVMLRQSEKLATLGTLAAGVAHELNNPAAAAQRGAGQLRPAFEALQRLCVELATSPVTADQLDDLLRLDAELRRDDGRRADELGPLERSSREDDLERWLEDHGVPEPWTLAPDLVDRGSTEAQLDALDERFGRDGVGLAVAWLARSFAVDAAIGQITEGTGRIATIVGALRSYTYLDRGEGQLVDVTEGLDSTLVLLSSKLKTGVTVHRDYAPDLPRIVGRGGELNQVWTNLVDNAIAAMDGVGDLTVRTTSDGAAVTVEVEDTGAGMPADVAARVFDPFFTTKAPGEGTGLGLNISHRIVVEGHGGSIEVARAQPGGTVMRVVLPVAPATTGAGPYDEDLPADDAGLGRPTVPGRRDVAGHAS